jgi:hypothetical protein
MGVLVLLFLVAGAVRLYRLDAPGMLVGREIRSAVLARDFYFSQLDSVPAWRKEVARAIRRHEPTLEPPVTELIFAALHRVNGREQWWYGRLVPALFWIVGGIFMYRIASSLIGTADGPVFATAFYLLSPLSILLSRSIQPDGLMMLMFLVSLLGIVRYHERPSPRLLGLTALACGLTVLHRPVVLFALAGAFVMPMIQRRGLRNALLSRDTILFLVAAALPAVLYFGYGTVISGGTRQPAQNSFRPNLLLQPLFWRDWLDLAVAMLGFTPILAGLVGWTLLPRGLPRGIASGLALGYVAFGLVFTMHIHTHGYYHAQAIPLIAIAAAPLVTLLLDQVSRSGERWYRWLPVAAAAGLMVWTAAREVRSQLEAPPGFERPALAREIGKVVNHSTRVVFVSRMYGFPLEYYGELSGSFWPRPITYWRYRRKGERPRTLQERLDSLNFVPEYFVVTDFREFEAHHGDLRQFLEGSCELAAQRPAYLVYRNCRIGDRVHPESG